MAEEKLVVKGARVHNLKNIDVEMPRDQLIVITGLSGSGKSSLAFDTIYAEGQRRYVESLSAYARQFLGLMERPTSITLRASVVDINRTKDGQFEPEVDGGYSDGDLRLPASALCQGGNAVLLQMWSESPAPNRRSDHRFHSAIPRRNQNPDPRPVVRAARPLPELFEQILKDGFVRVRVDGEIREIKDGMKVDRYKIHTIEIVVDRVTVKKEGRSRVAESVEVALRYGNGTLVVYDGENDHLYSSHYACHLCGLSYEEPAPSSFSFNSPAGSCPECEGLGEKRAFELQLIIPDETQSINEGGWLPLASRGRRGCSASFARLPNRYGFDFDTPFAKLSPKARDVLLNGAGDEKFEIEYTQSGGRTVTIAIDTVASWTCSKGSTKNRAPAISGSGLSRS